MTPKAHFHFLLKGYVFFFMIIITILGNLPGSEGGVEYKAAASTPQFDTPFGSKGPLTGDAPSRTLIGSRSSEVCLSGIIKA